MDILSKDRIGVEEMRAYYATRFPYFEANNQRIGRFAKQMSYMLTKQMKNRKYEYFYIKVTPNSMNDE